MFRKILGVGKSLRAAVRSSAQAVPERLHPDDELPSCNNDRPEQRLSPSAAAPPVEEEARHPDDLLPPMETPLWQPTDDLEAQLPPRPFVEQGEAPAAQISEPERLNSDLEQAHSAKKFRIPEALSPADDDVLLLTDKYLCPSVRTTHREPSAIHTCRIGTDEDTFGSPPVNEDILLLTESDLCPSSQPTRREAPATRLHEPGTEHVDCKPSSAPPSVPLSVDDSVADEVHDSPLPRDRFDDIEQAFAPRDAGIPATDGHQNYWAIEDAVEFDPIFQPSQPSLDSEQDYDVDLAWLDETQTVETDPAAAVFTAASTSIDDYDAPIRVRIAVSQIIETLPIFDRRSRTQAADRLHSLFRAHPHSSTIRAIVSQAHKGVSLQDILAAAELKEFWQEDTSLWLVRRFSSVERSWIIKSSQAAKSKFTWKIAFNLIERFNAEIAGERMLHDWHEAWLNMNRTQQDPTSQVNNAFYDYATYLGLLACGDLIEDENFYVEMLRHDLDSGWAYEDQPDDSRAVLRLSIRNQHAKYQTICRPALRRDGMDGISAVSSSNLGEIIWQP